MAKRKRAPLLEERDVRRDILLAQRCAELRWIDPYWKRSHPDQRPVLLHPIGGPLQAQNARTRGNKVASVVVDVEANEVGLQDATEELLPVGQGAVVLAARERRVQEEADLRV